MRANTKKKHGKRFAIVIGVAAAGVMALGAQTAAADVRKYDTTLSLSKDHGPNYYGFVWSDRDRNPKYHQATAVRKCMVGRRVVVFELRPGADRRLGVVRSTLWVYPGAPGYPRMGYWYLGRHPYGARVRAKVERKVGDGYVCLADRAAFGAWPQYPY